jgi:hypothetical protein
MHGRDAEHRVREPEPLQLNGLEGRVQNGQRGAARPTIGTGNALLVATVLLLAACSSSSGGTDSGQPTDAGPDAGPDGGPVVASCATGCGNGLTCVKNADFPAGACLATCASNVCPSRTVCSPVLSSGNQYCLQECAGISCPDSLVCTQTSVGGVCLPAAATVPTAVQCAAPQLLVGPVPGPATDPGCRMPVVSSSLPVGEVQSLGIHQVGETLSFNVPAGSIGFSIVSQGVVVASPTYYYGAPFPNLPVPSPLLAPSGATFFDDLVMPQQDLTTLLVVSGLPSQDDGAAYTFFSAALNFPNSSAGLALALDGGLPTGTWSFGVNDYAAECFGLSGCDAGPPTNTYDMSVLVSPGPLPSPGTLALDVYLVTTTLDAGSAVTSPAIEKFASRFAEFYAQAGICVRTITFHDVPAWAQAKYDSISVSYDDVSLTPCSDYHQLFTLAVPGRTVPLFFVDDLVNGNAPPGDVIIGQDGAIPAPPAFNGTVAGGAVVLAADLGSWPACGTEFNPAICGPDLVGAIAAHETGHFLGLLHTTEQTGDFFDPLIDTPACVCALCVFDPPAAAAACSSNPDGGQPTIVDNTVCSTRSQQCGGASFLMFWLLSTDTQGLFSAEESAVMRANPLISAP